MRGGKFFRPSGVSIQLYPGLPAADGPAHLLDDGQVGLVEEVHIDLGGGVGTAVTQGLADKRGTARLL